MVKATKQLTTFPILNNWIKKKTKPAPDSIRESSFDNYHYWQL